MPRDVAALARLARQDHERTCPGDEPLETRSVIHQWTHEKAARKQLAARNAKSDDR